MKLYATVKSNRAIKAQGGDWLHIEILDASEKAVAMFDVYPGEEKTIIEAHILKELAVLTDLTATKGEKQKGETPQLCKHGVRNTAVCIACWKS